MGYKSRTGVHSFIYTTFIKHFQIFTFFSNLKNQAEFRDLTLTANSDLGTIVSIIGYDRSGSKVARYLSFTTNTTINPNI